MSINVRERGRLFHFVEQEEDEGSRGKNSANSEVSLSQLASLPNGHEMTRCEVTTRAKLRLT